ncbi:MAG: trypsin-like peptidase domain-containing protein, partial [Thermaerobacterales bacterium]
TGSGVIFDSRGYIVTNFHVVEGADALEVVVADGRTLEAELVAHDFPFSDLAVLRVSPSEVDDVEYAAFADSGQLRVGETVIAIGNPQGLQFFRSVTVGVVSGIRTDLLQQLGGGTSSERIFELIQTDAAINRGNSGGPLVNLAGQVVGINTLKFAAGDVEGMGFAIPSSDVRRVVEDLIEHGYVIRPAIGALLLPDEVARSRYGVDDGVIISDVVANGPSARAGLREGDVILSLGGTPTPTFLELLKEINAHQVGDAVEVKIRRDEEELSVDVELGELGPPQGR